MRSVLTPQAGLQTLPQPRHRLSYGFPALPKAPSRAKHVPCAESSFSLPSSREEAIEQAVDALQSSLAVGKKRRKKGQALWAGVKRLVIEIPVQETTAQAELELAEVLLKALPPAAGTPLVVFGSQATTDHARAQDAPFVVYSLEECFAEDDGEDEELKGPLILMGASAQQAAACQRLIDKLWSGRLVLLANAGWMREAQDEVQAWMRSFDVIYYFLPVQFAGFLGGNRLAHIFKWNLSKEDPSKWVVLLQEDGSEEVTRIGQMDTRPSNADLEAMVYNIGASKSPVTQAAKAARGLFDRFSK